MRSLVAAIDSLSFRRKEGPEVAAAPDEVLVPSTVKDPVAGSRLTFADRGMHHLKGVPDEWRLYAVQ